MLLLMLAGYGSGEAGRSMALQLLKEDAIGLLNIGDPLVARLLELTGKGNLTPEDVGEVYKTARELYMKYSDKAPEAIRALIHAAALVGTLRGALPANLIKVDAGKWGRLLELANKDELTPSEVNELYTLAREFYEEYIDNAPEAVLVLAYASLRKFLTMRQSS